MSRSSPKAAVASRRAEPIASSSSLSSRTTRIPLPPPPAAGLTINGMPIADAAARSAACGLIRVVVARDDRDLEAGREAPRRSLVAHRPDRSGGGPTQRMPAAITRSAKSAFSLRNPKPGMERLGPGSQCRRDDRDRVEEIHGGLTALTRNDRPNPEPVAGPPDPRGDLPPVRNEQRDGSDVARPVQRRGSQTRLTRQTRHASVPQPVEPGADRSRSSAGRSGSRSRDGARPGSDSTPTDHPWRDCRVALRQSQAAGVSPLDRA